MGIVRRVWAGCIAGAAGLAAGAEDPSAISFNHVIQPILSNHCFACHGPDGETRAAGLRLDIEEEALKALSSGAFALVPGKPSESAVYHRITTADGDDRMPPAEFNKPLSEAQIAAIAAWIEQGAKYEAHWSFVPVKRPAVPEPADASWARNPIDRFVLSRLEAEGLKPSPEASKELLIRRVTLDLTGLPPTPAEIDAFLTDNRPDAYEHLVERLFASPRYGEHQARYWMDAARYADTNGFHIDNERFMWPWRDWVIGAFNRNQPFDDFTVEQIAGDLLPDATLEQRIASGFNRNHMINFEGGAIPEEYQTAYVLDRVGTTSTVWLGLTMACAQCHDHKYDPISQREFFEFYAFFNTIQEVGLDGREGNAEPRIKAPSPEQAAKLAAFDNDMAAIRAALLSPRAELDAKQAVWEAEWREKIDARWSTLTPETAVSAGGATLTILDDGAVLASGENPATDVYEVTYVTDQTDMTGLKLDVMTDASFAEGGAGRSPNANFVLSEVEVLAGPTNSEDITPVRLVNAAADFSQENFPATAAIDGAANTAWAGEGQTYREPRSVIFTFGNAVHYLPGTRLTVRFRFESEFPHHAFGRFRLSAVSDPAMEPAAMGRWYINGPYRAVDGPAAFGTDFGPEAAINLEESYPDGRLKWMLASPGFEDGVTYDLYGDVAATYLYREISSKTAREVTIGLGTNDAVKMWVNGALVHENPAARGLTRNSDIVAVRLNEGKNTLLLKVVNYGSAYAFAFDRVAEQVGEIPLDIELALAKDADGRRESEKAAVLTYFRRANDPEYAVSETKLAEIEQQRKMLDDAIPTTMVMAEAVENPRQTFILDRGEYDKPTVPVEPGTPKVLPALATAESAAKPNRLDLARWLVSPENPLPARVIVNRYWERYFGTGIVKTTEDFGVQGAWPSHPELLDWLAAEFMESGWDVQHMHRLIVTSAAYRQASFADPELRVRDPENRLLARGPRFRLDAEMIRDNALAVSGLLVERIGGPSVKPYQPPGIWEEVAYGGGNANFSANTYVADTGEKLYRRSMYTFWKRTAPPPSMMLFDTPNRETCQVSRARTNTPLQALALMNDPQYVEAARALAQRMVTEGGDDPASRIAYGFRLVTARQPKAPEIRVLEGLLAEQTASFKSDAAKAKAFLAVGEFAPDGALDPDELAAYATVASVILNLDETVNKS